MSHFNRALEFVLYSEGGYVFDPLDPGGPTNMGITQATLSQWFGVSVSPEDVKNLSKQVASEIYSDLYWGPVGGYLLKQFPTAAAMFDAAVLFGVGTATRFAQQAFNLATPAISSALQPLKVDGHIGAKSIDALNSLPGNAFTRSFHALLSKRVESIVASRPTSQKFKKGWDKRIARYLTLTHEGGWHL